MTNIGRDRRQRDGDPIETAPERRARPSWVVTIVAGSGLVLALAGSGIAAAATNSHTGGKPPGPGARPPDGGNGGIVSALGTDSITITTMDGTSATFTTTDSTTYRKDGSSTSVSIISPSLRGTVVSVASGVITIEDNQGFYRTIDTSGSTTFLYGGASSTIASVTMGEELLAVGSVDANHTDLDATTVGVLLPRTMGKVKSISGSTFVLEGPGSSTVTVTETASTAYLSGTSTTATSSIVAVGAMLDVEGTKDSSGNFTATSIHAVPSPAGRVPSSSLGETGNSGVSDSGTPDSGAWPGGPGGPGGPGRAGPGGDAGF